MSGGIPIPLFWITPWILTLWGREYAAWARLTELNKLSTLYLWPISLRFLNMLINWQCIGQNPCFGNSLLMGSLQKSKSNVNLSLAIQSTCMLSPMHLNFLHGCTCSALTLTLTRFACQLKNSSPDSTLASKQSKAIGGIHQPWHWDSLDLVTWTTIGLVPWRFAWTTNRVAGILGQ